LFPIVPGPAWFNNKSQPIAVQNVIDYLFAALTNPNGRGKVFEIGGPEVTFYKDLMLKYAHARGHKRSMILLPYVPLWFMAFGVGLMTPVPHPIAYALIGGLSADSVVKQPEALTIFPEVELIGFGKATRDALDQLTPARIERIWNDGNHDGRLIKHEGCFILHHEIKVDASAEKMFQAVSRFANRPNWQVESREENERVLVYVKNQIAGEKWLEWRMTGRSKNEASLSQTVFFAPRGPGGFMYWYLQYPFYAFVFPRLIRAIAKRIHKE
jgi:hypothetical protein